MKCWFCDNIVPQGRIDIGKRYCMDRACVSKGMAGNGDNVRLVLMPKQGFTYVFSNSSDVRSSRSSGR
jgi:hypothetical protein